MFEAILFFCFKAVFLMAIGALTFIMLWVLATLLFSAVADGIRIIWKVFNAR